LEREREREVERGRSEHCSRMMVTSCWNSRALLKCFLLWVMMGLAWEVVVEREVVVGRVEAALGVNWGTNSINPMPPGYLVKMLQQNNITKVKLFDADYHVVSSMAGTGIEVMVAAPNDMLYNLATDPNAAPNWVKENVTQFLFNGGVNIRWVPTTVSLSLSLSTVVVANLFSSLFFTWFFFFPSCPPPCAPPLVLNPLCKSSQIGLPLPLFSSSSSWTCFLERGFWILHCYCVLIREILCEILEPLGSNC
jgi:hypothetical protein